MFIGTTVRPLSPVGFLFDDFLKAWKNDEMKCDNYDAIFEKLSEKLKILGKLFEEILKFSDSETKFTYQPSPPFLADKNYFNIPSRRDGHTKKHKESKRERKIIQKTAPGTKIYVDRSIVGQNSAFVLNSFASCVCLCDIKFL